MPYQMDYFNLKMEFTVLLKIRFSIRLFEIQSVIHAKRIAQMEVNLRLPVHPYSPPPPPQKKTPSIRVRREERPYKYLLDKHNAISTNYMELFKSPSLRHL